ncbi:unannotated protein [freshwater metagenome]|uniref:Unannotated protein n=1 Tax=freshwater metagenome TaxID=449393 RepID=A0A6J7V876_9ZZZZ
MVSMPASVSRVAVTDEVSGVTETDPAKVN